MQCSRHILLVCCLCLALLCSMLPLPIARVAAQHKRSGNPAAPKKNRALRGNFMQSRRAPTVEPSVKPLAVHPATTNAGQTIALVQQATITALAPNNATTWLQSVLPRTA